MNKETLIKVQNVGLYKNEKWLVRGVSLEVKRGEIVTLIGPNGSGKTTTAKIALGIYKNIEGEVLKFTKKIGYVPQKISIDWTLPIRVVDFMLLTEKLNDEEINYVLDFGIFGIFVFAGFCFFCIFGSLGPLGELNPLRGLAPLINNH